MDDIYFFRHEDFHCSFYCHTDSSGNILSVSYNGNNEEIKYQIGPNSFIQVNLPGRKIIPG